MKAFLRSVRIAPKKANLIAKMVRGMPVPAALASLRRTNKKAARIIEKLLASAVANAEHNDKQDPSVLVIRTIVVNQGVAMHRGVPMARGRIRPMRKFLSHISLTLGVAEQEGEKSGASSKKAEASAKKAGKTAAKPSQGGKNEVQKARSSQKKPKASEDSSDSSGSSSSAASA